MSSVAVKTTNQQADAIVLRHREMLVNQRTHAINALREHATDWGGCRQGAANPARLFACRSRNYPGQRA
jgi:transposase